MGLTTKIIMLTISGIILYATSLDTIPLKRYYPDIAMDLTVKIYKYKMSWKLNTIGGFRDKIKNGN